MVLIARRGDLLVAKESYLTCYPLRPAVQTLILIHFHTHSIAMDQGLFLWLV